MKRFSLLLASLVLLGTVVVAQGSVVSKADLKRAQVFAEAGKWDEALKVTQAMLKQDPRHVDALYLQGLCYLGLKDYPKARESLQLVISLEPQFMPAYQQVGYSYVAEKNYEEAKKHFSKLLMVPGGQATAEYSLGVVAYAQQDLIEAQKRWKQAILSNPGMAAAHNNLGILHQLAGNQPLALSEFQDAVRLQPESPSYKLNLGIQLVEMNRSGEAKRYLNDVMQQNQRSDLALAAAAYMAYLANENDKAVKLARMALAKNDELTQMMMLEGKLQERMSKPSEARAAYAKALESDPNLEEARKALARLGPEPSPSPQPEASPPPQQPLQRGGDEPETVPENVKGGKGDPIHPQPSATPPHDP
ncbi:hypothetical protein DYH09_32140 [bacterium CPR1]|nr:hypothetical protein [bacterium CPR1]